MKIGILMQLASGAVFCVAGTACKENKISVMEERPSNSVIDECREYGFDKQLSRGETPLKVVRVTAASSIEVSINSSQEQVGVIVRDGFNLMKSYHDPVLRVTNSKVPHENFSTSYSAFRAFSADHSGAITITLVNSAREDLLVLLYEIANQK